jgi:hypothetical protein
MRDTTRTWTVLALVLLAAPARAQDPAPKPVLEYWDAAYLEGVKAGYFHTVVVQTERDGKKLFETTQELRLKIKRDDSLVLLKMDNTVEETADGKVLGMSVTMYTPGKMTVSGRVEGDKLVMLSGGRELKRLPWDASSIGLYAQDRAWREKKVKAGDRFDFTTFELAIEKAFKMRVTVKNVEPTDVLEVKKGDPKMKAEPVSRPLLRVEGVPDKVEVGGAPLQLPMVVTWLDKEWNVVRSETRMPGLGRIIMYRTTKAIATEEGVAPAALPDLLLTTLIPVNRAIDRPYDRSEVVFRITVLGDDDPKTTFARDARQSAENGTGRTFDLRVRAQRAPGTVERPQPVTDECRKANHFLDSDDDIVQALTGRAVGGEKDSWAKAKRIEKWVHDNMSTSTSVVFATASQIARDLKGDCRQHAMLTAAMCRATGLPSRTAVGLVYTVDPQKGPVLAFHMWTEVYVADQWLALDAMLGQGGVSATHLKVSDSSWHDTQTLTPLLSVLRVLDKVKVEVVAVK